MILPQLILQVSAALYPYISSSRIQLFGCEKISGRFRVTDYSRIVLISGRSKNNCKSMSVGRREELVKSKVTLTKIKTVNSGNELFCMLQWLRNKRVRLITSKAQSIIRIRTGVT